MKIDYAKVLKLAQIMCTLDEVAAVMGIARSTLEIDPKFLAVMRKGQSTGRISLRRAQFHSATQGRNVSSQIWLGKQVLGQRDTPLVDDDQYVPPVQVVIEVEDGRRITLHKPLPDLAADVIDVETE